MSNRRRVRPIEALRSQVQPGWCGTLDQLEQLKRLTHDSVIAAAGDRRRSGVTWHVCEAQHAFDVVAELRRSTSADDPADGAEADVVFDTIEQLLREHGGYLVVAVVDVVAPPRWIEAPV